MRVGVVECGLKTYDCLVWLKCFFEPLDHHVLHEFAPEIFIEVNFYDRSGGISSMAEAGAGPVCVAEAWEAEVLHCRVDMPPVLMQGVYPDGAV